MSDLEQKIKNLQNALQNPYLNEAARKNFLAQIEQYKKALALEAVQKEAGQQEEQAQAESGSTAPQGDEHVFHPIETVADGDTLPEWSRLDPAKLTSPYCFVPLNEQVVYPEDCWEQHDGGRAAPLSDGLCAEVDVEWIAETPILVGGEKTENGNDISPASLAGKWCLPGATLRGHVRAILQTVAYGRLWPMNSETYMPLRHFEHPMYGRRVGRADNVKAGFLTIRAPKGAKGVCDNLWDAEWFIEPCENCGLVSIDGDLAEQIGYFRNNGRTQWLQQPYRKKYLNAGMLKGGHLCFEDDEDRTRVLSFRPARDDEKDADSPRDNQYVIDPDGNLKGVLVFGGAMRGDNPNKKYEYVFFRPAKAEPIPLSQEAKKRFCAIAAKRVGNQQRLELTMRIDGAKVDVLEIMRNTLMVGKPAPVFYSGDLSEQDNPDEPLVFGFTRTFRIAHANTPGMLAKKTCENLLPEKGGDAYRPSFVENLFGYVHEPDRENQNPENPEKTFQLKGRVSFGFALAEEGAFELSGPVETIMGTPNPSFAPFYLDGKAKDWSWPDARLAGRKRYVPRYQPGGAGQALAGISGRLEGQIEAARRAANGREPGQDARTRLKFLVPVREGAKFKSRIRLFNVTRAELGAVLWALTFGGQTGTYRHMIGHARPFGAGQVKTGNVRLRVRENTQEAWSEANDPEIFMKAFEAFMEQRVPGWRESHVVKGYLCACDPRTWSNQTARLTYPEFPGGFRELKDATMLKMARPSGKAVVNPDGRPGVFLPACGEE